MVIAYVALLILATVSALTLATLAGDDLWVGPWGPMHAPPFVPTAPEVDDAFRAIQSRAREDRASHYALAASRSTAKRSEVQARLLHRADLVARFERGEIEVVPPTAGSLRFAAELRRISDEQDQRDLAQLHAACSNFPWPDSDRGRKWRAAEQAAALELDQRMAATSCIVGLALVAKSEMD